jgi:hypothetical protein
MTVRGKVLVIAQSIVNVFLVSVFLGVLQSRMGEMTGASSGRSGKGIGL